jgi:hypothetical protein
MKTSRLPLTVWSAVLVLTALLAPTSIFAADPAKPVTFTVNGATTQPISPFIYGTNMPDWAKHKNLTLCRWGGTRGSRSTHARAI